MPSTSSKIKTRTSLFQNTTGTIASVGMVKLGANVASNLVTPAIWGLNYATSKSKPNIVDIGVYGSGFISAGVGIVMSTFKAIMDDDINSKVNAIRIRHEAKYRPFILPVQNYSYNPPFVGAMEVAKHGGTAWQGMNGQWVYITDATGRPVANFKPNNYLKIIQPSQPIDKKPNGTFAFCSLYCKDN